MASGDVPTAGDSQLEPRLSPAHVQPRRLPSEQLLTSKSREERRERTSAVGSDGRHRGRRRRGRRRGRRLGSPFWVCCARPRWRRGSQPSISGRLRAVRRLQRGARRPGACGRSQAAPLRRGRASRSRRPRHRAAARARGASPPPARGQTELVPVRRGRRAPYPLTRTPAGSSSPTAAQAALDSCGPARSPRDTGGATPVRLRLAWTKLSAPRRAWRRRRRSSRRPPRRRSGRPGENA